MFETHRQSSHAVELRVVVCRVVCPVFGPSHEWIPLLDQCTRVTTRVAEKGCQIAEIMTIKDVTETILLAQQTVKTICKR